jgi:uncharacterized membrane protein YbhN (UPF0104 family)
VAAALVGAGVTGHHALAAVLVYRVVSFWLVMACGWVVMAVLVRSSAGRSLHPSPVHARS